MASSIQIFWAWNKVLLECRTEYVQQWLKFKLAKMATGRRGTMVEVKTGEDLEEVIT